MQENKKKILSASLKAFAAVLAASLLFYYFLDRHVSRETERLQGISGGIQEEIQTEKGRSEQIARMKRESELGRRLGSMVFPYDNAAQELAYLSSMMTFSAVYDLSFDEPSLGKDSFVRRGVNIDFKAENYETARYIIDGISASPYRTIFRTLSVSAIEPDPSADLIDRSISGNCRVAVSANVVFIESVENGSDQRGLKKIEQK